MVAGHTAVSHLFAQRFLRLALEAESNSAPHLARARFLMAIRHDPTPGSGLEFGRFLAESGHLEDAILVVEDCWQLARRRSNANEIATCCRRLASLFQRTRQASQAKRFLQRAAAAEMSAWSEHDATLSSEQLLIESQFAEREGDLTRAVALCLGALQVAAGPNRGAALRHRAKLSTIQGDRRAAAHDLLTAAQIARKAGDHRDYAACLLELGHVLLALDRPLLAVDCYRTACLRFGRAGRTRLAGVAQGWLRQTAAVTRAAGGKAEWN